MPEAELVCEVRYHIDRNSLEEFSAYARTWVALIERYGGHHHGYLVSREAPAGATISFPDQGEEDVELIAVARFTFPNEESYLRYRDGVRSDPDGIAANSRYERDPPFKKYTRTFLEKLA